MDDSTSLAASHSGPTLHTVNMWQRTLRLSRTHNWLIGLALALTACAASDPSPVEPGPTAISPVAAAYLEEFVALLQRYSVKRFSIDWKAFRADVLAAAGPAQSTSETVPGIRRALALLGDGHSVYIPTRGTPVGAPTKTCDAPLATRPATSNVGYVRVRQFAGSPAQATLYAQQLHDSIRVADRDGIAGWIVDLRGNSGGNVYPMIAGIGPIIGDGVLGYFLDADNVFTPFSYSEGVSSYADEQMHQVSAVYHLKRPNPRVAVLTDGWVASSGEAIAVAFRGRPNTRSFGTATCGLSTGNATYFLSDASRVVVTVSTMADRTRRAYGDIIVPDEVIANSGDAIARAISWLTYADQADALPIVRVR